MNASSKIKLRILTVFSIILLCIAVVVREFQNDTFYIIKLGDFIFHNGVDLVDHYSWVTDLLYTYPHWLYDLFIYIVYSNFGFVGVYASSIVLFIILILSIYLINLDFNKNELMASIISIGTIPLLIGFVTARAQLVTIILFLWEVYFIRKLIDTGSKKYVVFISGVSLLVANLHATIWLFCFILFLPFIGQFIIRWFLNKLGNNNVLFFDKLEIESIKNFGLLVLAFISSFLMGFLSPSKICFTYVFKVMQGSSQSFITEHAPMVLIENISFLILIAVVIGVLIFSKTRIKLFELFMIGGLLFMSLSSFRHVAFFYVIGLLFVSVLFNRCLLNNKDKTLDILGYLVTKNKIIYVLLFVIVLLVSGVKFYDNSLNEFIPEDMYPVHAVNYIKDNLDVNELHLYNDYNFGAYLLFYDIPVFIDSRCDLYLKEFNGLDYSIFDDSMNMMYDYEEKFLFYDVSHVLIQNDSYFYRIISKDENYVILYEDDNFTLFEVNKIET